MIIPEFSPNFNLYLKFCFSLFFQKFFLVPSSPGLQTLHNRSSPAQGVTELMAADFVFVRMDHPSKPTLDPLYAGPYKVLQKSSSFFTVLLGEKKENINAHIKVHSGPL